MGSNRIFMGFNEIPCLIVGWLIPMIFSCYPHCWLNSIASGNNQHYGSYGPFRDDTHDDDLPFFSSWWFSKLNNQRIHTCNLQPHVMCVSEFAVYVYGGFRFVIGVPPVIIHFIDGILPKISWNKPSYGVPPWLYGNALLMQRPTPEHPTAARTTRASAVLVTWLHPAALIYVLSSWSR